MELRRIQFCSGCGDDSCGGCDCNPQLNSFEQQIKGVQGVQGKQGAQGVAGKNNVLNGSQLVDSNGGNQNGTDGSLGGTVATDFSNAGFDLTISPTMVATIDNSDIANTKYWARLSNNFLTWFSGNVLPKLLPSAGTSGNLLTSNGSIWTSATPVLERYNTTSVTSLAIVEALVNFSSTLTVDSGLAYRNGNPVRAVDVGNNDNYIEGVVESYTGISLTFKVTKVAGGGTPVSWKVGLGALQNVPYFSNTVGRNQFLTNNGQSLIWGTSAFPVASTIPWFGALSSPAPTGWLKCNGAIILKADYPELYALLSASTAFQIDANSCYLPNLIGKVPVGVDIGDANIDAIGEAYGTKTTTLVGDNLPENAPYNVASHTHDYFNDPAIGGFLYATGALQGDTAIPAGGFGIIAKATTGGTTGGTSSLTTNTGTGGTAFSNFQPSMACLYIIKY